MVKPYEFLSRTGDGVCVVDGEQRIVLWNDSASRLLGFSSDEVLGLPCYNVLGSTDLSGCTVCRLECVTSSAARRGELVQAREALVRTRDAGHVRVGVSTIGLPSSWHDLSVLAHLLQSADAREERESIDGLLSSPTGGLFTQEAATDPGPSRPIDELTRREYDVLRLLSTGASTETICTRLGIKTTTTRAHVRTILQKLGVRDRLEAVTFGVRVGLIEIARD